MNQSIKLPAVACVLGICFALLASACGSAEEAGIPKGCEATLTKRTSGPPTCRTQAQCDHVRAHPDHVVSFYFNLSKMSPAQGASYSVTQRLHNRQCVADFLRARGVTTLEADNGLNDVAVSASYNQTREAFDLSIVNDIELGCRTNDVCTQCTTLPAANCQQEPFCALRPSDSDPSRPICDIYGRPLPI